MITRFRNWLGEGRFYTLIGALLTTGAGSILLSFVDAPWATSAQTLIALGFLLLALVLILGRMDGDERRKWIAILTPALGLVLLGGVFLPEFNALLLGGAVGWVLAGSLIFGRSRAPQQYRVAIKHMRKRDYKEAVETMDELIKEQSDEPNHYRFRAELLRLWGKLGRARNDYQKMARLAEDKNDKSTLAVAYNGLAEVELQAERYDAAHQAALKAYTSAPDEWVAAYNLGMIEDRLGRSRDVINHLDEALKLKIKDARHRALIHFYRVRAYARLGDDDATSNALAELKRERRGLDEWTQILQSDQAQTLREVLAQDVEAARQLADEQLTPADLTKGAPV